MEPIYLLTAALAAVVAIVVLVFVFLHFYRVKKRKFAKCKIKPTLSRFCGLRKYRILEDVRFDIGEKPIVVPYVVVGIFGILVVTTIEDNGSIYGNVDDEHWVCDDEKNKRWYIPNWVKVNDSIVETLRKGLSKRNIYKTQIDAVTVFPYHKRELSVSSALPVIRTNKFSGYINRDKFNRENHVDIENLSKIVLDIAAGK